MRIPSDAWRAVLEQGAISTDAAVLRIYETATFAVDHTVTARLSPVTVEQVASCVRIAYQHHAHIYPVSRGRSIGLGSRVPKSNTAAVLDLGRLRTIRAYDEDFGVIVVEPGVTFAQADQFLRERNSPYFLAAVGAPPDSSVVGNILVRGDGLGPTGDRLDSLYGLEVVLPDGAIIHTGHWRFSRAQTVHLSRDGVGASLNGLFTQSALGIVTAAAVKLSRRPRYFQLLKGRVSAGRSLAALVNKLRVLLQEGVLLPYCVSLWNGIKNLTVTAQRHAISAATLEREAGRFTLSAGLYHSSAAIMLAVRDYVQQQLAPYLEQIEFDDTERTPSLFDTQLLLGVPTWENARSVYWAKPYQPTDFNPEGDRCGILWTCPLIPMRGDAVQEALKIAEAVLSAHGFDPVISVVANSASTFAGNIALLFDRDVPGADENALACHSALNAALQEAGFYPYRQGILDPAPEGEAAYDALLLRLETALRGEL